MHLNCFGFLLPTFVISSHMATTMSLLELEVPMTCSSKAPNASSSFSRRIREVVGRLANDRGYGLMITDMKGGDRMSFKRSGMTGRIEELTLAIQNSPGWRWVDRSFIKCVPRSSNERSPNVKFYLC
ncbi:hypothetical protein K443DRAFT_358560 [Laccaria amethystina LaAM-08-1]|uniref:Unplaced genomic scaffold K443scaffold_258, whole genome shotgun sequence n=1 Tax=Laccaria amethystina LaAM-08-1 TaxID=1095629 RepID=A0A0C9XE70_9AGAR|nr:hypothetical protein K443DRAFT_358560 [Laccaria amethystina LaAM-08-1]